MDPVSDELLHVDFIEVSLKELVNVTVSLAIAIEPVGVKMGGILERRLREIEVECLPMQIPDKIEIDAGHIEIGQSLHVSDLITPEGAKIITDPAEVVLSVSAPRAEEEVPAEAAEVEAAEPELVKGKGKEEGEEKPAEEKEK